MIRGILIGILSLAVIGSGYWGYKEHQEKNAVLIQAENNYQRAFHDLSYRVDQLHDRIGATLAMNSKKSLSPALVDVWRITSEAQSDVGQLPLALLPFNKTEEFLAGISDFSYRTAVRDLEKEPLSDDEYKTLEQMYTKSEEIQNELRNVQHLAIENNLRWMDVELALASGQKQADNTIIDGFKTVEENVEGYSEADFGTSFMSNEKEINKGFKELEGKEINEAEAKKIAKTFVSNGVSDVKVAKNGEGSKFEFYSVSMHDKKNNVDVNMDLTQKGGHPIFLVQNREVKKQSISLNEASNSARKFLEKHGFKDLDLFESDQYDNIGVFSFVSINEGVRIYPDAIKMKVALDDGKVIGFSARDYLAAHKKREIEKPKISKEAAAKMLNPSLAVQEDRLAIIVDEFGEEVLCFEFLGTINKDTYRIFINAENGNEEKIEKLKNPEPIFQEV
ncbi:germination protein YpeB [Metabacillus sediminilitoris]|uniref:Germination protein YpeB n=1 Tax=Metabacillus sediminilitoris TaxID=2567941 RepID=A0A4S4C518_9BACI|nr:germination protein YpeB [Metabacillus sediminilitoris]QGQ46716.1 germination protein YpeB [Metabacillus sediminilitoris]THF82866.1 germination protein YpeB [Metabacillus sediminilitoris]